VRFHYLLRDELIPTTSCLAQVLPLVLGISLKKKERHVHIVIKVDYARSTSLATPLQPPSQLANSSASWNNHSRRGVISQIVDQLYPFLVVHQFARGGEELFHLNDRDGACTCQK